MVVLTRVFRARLAGGLMVFAGCSAGGAEKAEDEAKQEACLEGDQQLTEMAIRDCVAGVWTEWRPYVCEPGLDRFCSLPGKGVPCAEESRALNLCLPPPSDTGLQVCLDDGSAWSACQIISGGPTPSLPGGSPGCTPGSRQNCPSTCLYDGMTTCLQTRELGPCLCTVR